MVILVLIQAIADPTGSARPGRLVRSALRFDLGMWPLAPYFVFVPVLLAVTWWATVRAGDRFWTLTAGLVLAVLARAGRGLLLHDLGSRIRGVGGRIRGREGRARCAHRRRRSPAGSAGTDDAVTSLSARIGLAAGRAVRRGHAIASPACGGRARPMRRASPWRAPTAGSCR